MSYWNNLLDEVVTANTIESFKLKLDEYWRLKMDMNSGLYSLSLIICPFIL